MTDKITLTRQTVDYAAHALEHFNKDAPDRLVSEIIHHLRAALAAEQPKPEPVAMFDERMGQPVLLPRSPMLEDGQFLYTAPPDIEALRRQNERLREALTYDWDQLKACRESLREHMVEIKRLRGLLSRIREWDHLDTAADGAFWKHEIDAALRREDV